MQNRNFSVCQTQNLHSGAVQLLRQKLLQTQLIIAQVMTMSSMHMKSTKSISLSKAKVVYIF